MKDFKFKTTVENPTGRLFPQNPGVPPGKSADGRVYTYEVRAVPDDVPPAEVMRQASGTIWARRQAAGRYTANYSELGVGAILSPRPFSEALRDARKRAGLTQMKLAEKSGVSQGRISELEAGICEPGLPTIRKLADALGVTPAKLIK